MHFEDIDATEQFYSMVVSPEAKNVKAKLSSFSDVRSLKQIVSNSEAMSVLLDPDRNLIDALTVARRDEITRKWRTEISEAITALQKVSAFELKKFSEADTALLNQLIDTATQILSLVNDVKD